MAMHTGPKNDAAERYRAFSEDADIQSVVHGRLGNHGDPVDEEGILEFVRKHAKDEAEYIGSMFDK